MTRPDPSAPTLSPAFSPAPLEMDVAAAPPIGIPPGGLLRKVMLSTGSAALLLAMATDALAVAGRHIGFTFLGAIEIVEACVVVAATSAIVIAALDDTHARVRILLEQVRPRTADIMERGGSVVAAVVMLSATVGSSWLARDLWPGQEITEVLGIPLRWLRLFWIAGTVLTAVIFARHAGRRRR